MLKKLSSFQPEIGRPQGKVQVQGNSHLIFNIVTI
jgi:hypothetical protein